jgi:acetyltransferase-like isoleucine patch superfamily enzyme
MDMSELKDLDDDLKELWSSLIRLHHRLRDHTKDTYNRINPFYEDLFEWSERGSYFTNSGKGITIYNSATIVGDVKIGEHTWIGPFCSLDGDGGLSIGRYCSISLGCQILTHDTVKWALSGGLAKYERTPTKIGNCCFLGSYVVVTKGVTIGNHCVIGAGAVVTRDVPDYAIVSGVPARRIGTVHIDEDKQVRLEYHHDLI